MHGCLEGTCLGDSCTGLVRYNDGLSSRRKHTLLARRRYRSWIHPNRTSDRSLEQNKRVVSDGCGRPLNDARAVWRHKASGGGTRRWVGPAVFCCPQKAPIPVRKETFGQGVTVRDKCTGPSEMWHGMRVGMAIAIALADGVVAKGRGRLGRKPVPCVGGELGTRRTGRNARFDGHRLGSVKAAMWTGAGDQHVLARHDHGNGGCASATCCRTAGK